MSYVIGYAISITGTSNGVKRAQMRGIWSKWAKNFHFTALWGPYVDRKYQKCNLEVKITVRNIPFYISICFISISDCEQSKALIASKNALFWYFSFILAIFVNSVQIIAKIPQPVHFNSPFSQIEHKTDTFREKSNIKPFTCPPKKQK